jgi:adenine-specific DNA-methyltransferase
LKGGLWLAIIGCKGKEAYMQNLLDDLTKLLDKSGEFTDENGDLLKNKIIESALKLDPGLIKLLLKNKETQKHFFTDIDGVLVFDKIKFQIFVSNKQFLPDSYTAFKNRIGLVDEKGEFISSSGDVTLVWPYKDCVLEGDQTKEEQKRDEIFWNETLAPDEIDRLFDPKVLTNWKRYDEKGEHILKGTEKIDFNNENLIIKGNNLLALYSIYERYAGKVKLIYIDPPYNTGGAANTFAYNNTFNHSTWLTFMKNRLEIAKKLLCNSGTICIAIDDEEYAHLKLLCDEIFTRDNYVGTIIVQSNPRGRTINSHFATCHEYALFYAKNIASIVVNNQELTDEQESSFNKSDKDGKYRLLPFRRSGGTSTPDERPNSEFALYYSTEYKKIIAVGGERKGSANDEYKPIEILVLDNNGEVIAIKPNVFFENNHGVIAILPIDVLGKRRVWRWSDRKAILKAAADGDLIVSLSGSNLNVQLKDRIKYGRKPKTIWTDSKYDASANGTILLKNIFDGEKAFSYPKSIYTVKDTIEMLTDSDNEDIVLDFFAGSGTTAHAVLELNKSDGGNRRYILCEQMDYVQTVTTKRINTIVNDIKEGGSFIYCELMQWNELYMDKIQKAKTASELKAIWKEISQKAFYYYFIDVKIINENISDFDQLPIKDQKKFLIETLDKNQLYVNHSEIDDIDYKVSDEDKKLTSLFYSRK